MTELIDRPHLKPAENLSLEPQIPIEFVTELKRVPDIAEKLPTGEIAYYDVRQPGRLTVLGTVRTRSFTIKEKIAESQKARSERRDRKRFVDWRQFQNPVLAKTYSLEEAADTSLACVIVRTPSRTQDDSYEEDLELLAPLVKERSEKKNGIIKKRHMGALIVAEDPGDDQFKGWRRDQMKRHGLVTNETANPKDVDSLGNYFVTFGRPAKERGAVDLTQGRISGNMFTDFTDEIERKAFDQGLEADTSDLIEEAKATKFVPRTLSNLREGGNVTYRGADDRGNATHFRRDRYGEQTAAPSTDGFDVRVTPDKKNFPKKTLNPLIVEATLNPGHIVQTDLPCFKCKHEGHKSKLYYKNESVEMDDGTKKRYIFMVCPSHGARTSQEAPSVEEAMRAKR